MVTIEQKIGLFSKLISQEVENEISEKEKLFEQEKAEKIEKVQKDANKKALEIYKANESKIKEKITEIKTRSKIEARNKVLNLKENCIKEMLKRLEEKALSFTDTKEYAVYLKKVIEDAVEAMGTQDNLQVIVKDKDVSQVKEWLGDNNIKVVTTKEHIIGGAIIVNTQNYTRLDFSMKARLENNKALVVDKVMGELEKVGDEIE